MAVERSEVRHPAKFSEAIIERMAGYLKPGWWVLDPFAGVGRVFDLCRYVDDLTIVGVEIEEEWAKVARAHPFKSNGMLFHEDALKWMADRVPVFNERAPFDAIVTSPTYGNRMADHHNAKDSSRRHTYKSYLGRDLTPGNSGAMQWGEKYREFHAEAWRLAVALLKPGGLFVLNCKDHVRKLSVVKVTAWHTQTLLELGMDLIAADKVFAPGLRHGDTGGERVDYEWVKVFRKGDKG
jgi:tRNA G10  N-methylase Trm11